MVNIIAKFDLAIIGGGIIGLAIARRVSIKHPKLRICVLEKERELASHQSKRNSGVVHCGIYYKKFSLKSRFCIRGAELVKNYCLEKGLPYHQCGKLIIATDEEEVATLRKLHDNAIVSGIQGVQLLTPGQVGRVQPECTNVMEAIWSPNTAIVDWQKVALSYADDFRRNDGTIYTQFIVDGILDGGHSLHLKKAGVDDFIGAKSVINCAGLSSDFFPLTTGNKYHPKIVPFKGRYYLLDQKLAKSIKTNIYPVPNPKLPFLGVHITPRIDGSVLIGPTALPSLGYYNYKPDDELFLKQIYLIFIASGLFRMLKNRDFRKAGLLELRQYLSKEFFTKGVRKLLPNIKPEDLIQTDFCGIRAQAIGSDGELIDDFYYETGLRPQFSRVLHLRNCPSPAATSSLAIAERIVKVLEERLI